MSSSKSSLPAKTMNNKFLTRRAKTCQPKEKRKKFYFTEGKEVDSKALKESDDVVFNVYKIPYKLKSMEEVKRYWKDEEERKLKEKEANYVDHHTYRSRLSSIWKRERLYVPEDTKLPGKSITENVDPEFFIMVSGRPIKEEKDLKQYLKDIRDCFLTRLRTGYLLDEMLLIDEQNIKENKELARVRGNFLSCSKSFDSFLKEDHESSLRLLETAERETKKSRTKLETVNGLRDALRKLQAEVLTLEEQWRNSKMFQKFLYVVAPAEWRKIHDPYYGKEDKGVRASDPCGFDNFRDFTSVSDTDLDEKIFKFKEDIKDTQDPVLYFMDPQQLVDILENLEENNQLVLAHCKKLDFPAEKITAEVKKAKAYFQQDQTNLKKEIKLLTTLIEAEEKKSKDNQEKLREIAYGLFRDLITNEEYLSVTSLVEDAYEDAVAPSDGNLPLLTMMKEIELKHESLLLALDLLPNDIMVRTTRSFFREQKRDLEEAREAEKKVRQMKTLSRRLSKSLAPLKRGAKERRTVRRSLPPKEVFVRFLQPKIMTKEERNDLFFFGTSEETKLHKPLFA